MNIAADWINHAVRTPDAQAAAAARARQDQLTKPPGALGQLEALAIRLAALQGRAQPQVEKIHLAVFAADHGVMAEGVSAFPQAVTAEMIRNFSCGGAAISVLANALDAQLEVVDLGTVSGLQDVPGVRHLALGPGTANLAQTAAMTAEQLQAALAAGHASAERAAAAGAELYIGGEMGIGNTTTAAALSCGLLNESPQQLAGPGSGLDTPGVQHKIAVIQRALDVHYPHLCQPLETLRRVGGFEIAALAGAFLRCAQIGLPVLVDGFIVTSAALAAERIHPGAAQWFLYAHTSAEPGHQRLLTSLGAQPLLQLGMRLGEGSGAALAVPLLRLACTLHNDMATFAEANISEKL